MPHGYEVMRDSFIRKGMSSKRAKKKAAMIWNSKHKGAEAVGRYSEADETKYWRTMTPAEFTVYLQKMKQGTEKKPEPKKVSPERLAQLRAEAEAAKQKKNEAKENKNIISSESRHDYFKRRLKNLGMFDEDSDYNGMIGKSIEELSDKFSKQGHSGYSSAITLSLFNKLFNEWNNPELRESVKSFANFMESRWEKPTQADKEKAYAYYDKAKHSTSQKNTKTRFHRRAEMDKVKFSAPHKPSWDMDPRRVTDLLKQDVFEDFPGQATGSGGNEGNEQGVGPASPTSSKPAKGIKLKYPKKPEEIVRPVEESSENHPIQNPETRAAVAKELKGTRNSYRAGHSPELIAKGQANRDMADELRSRSYSGNKRTFHTASFRMDSLGRKQIRAQRGPMAEETMKRTLDDFTAFMESYLDESKAHPGFKAVQAKVAKKYGKERAGAIVAAAARNASAKAKAKNPRLRKVKG